MVNDTLLYQVGDNFSLSVDSLMLQSSQPLHNQPVDTLCSSLHVYLDDALVVAEILVIPEDTVDSVWVKVARDQCTMGWVHQSTFLSSAVPHDPISRAIHLLGTIHPLVVAVPLAVALIALLWQIFSRRHPRVFFFRDIPSPYPTLLMLTVAVSALLYAHIQHTAPALWTCYYYHPTLNPFGQPLVLSFLLSSLWMLLILSIATISEVFRYLPVCSGLLYLLSLLGCLIPCHLLFASSCTLPLAPGLLVLLAVVLLLRYSRHSRARYLCGSCGRTLRQLGKCPHCGAVNR